MLLVMHFDLDPLARLFPKLFPDGYIGEINTVFQTGYLNRPHWSMEELPPEPTIPHRYSYMKYWGPDGNDP